MTSNQNSKCHGIIHTASTAAAAAATPLAQIPGSDSLAIVPIQIGMIISIATVFGKTISKETAKSILKTKAATFIGRKISQFLFGWIPIWGNALNASTAFTITETLGWKVAGDFDR